MRLRLANWLPTLSWYRAGFQASLLGVPDCRRRARVGSTVFLSNFQLPSCAQRDSNRSKISELLHPNIVQCFMLGSTGRRRPSLIDAVLLRFLKVILGTETTSSSSASSIAQSVSWKLLYRLSTISLEHHACLMTPCGCCKHNLLRCHSIGKNNPFDASCTHESTRFPIAPTPAMVVHALRALGSCALHLDNASCKERSIYRLESCRFFERTRMRYSRQVLHTLHVRKATVVWRRPDKTCWGSLA